MPIIKSAKKALRRDRRRTKVNQKIKKKVKDSLKRVRKSPTSTALKKASSALDQAAKKGFIHKNKASRLKSRISKLVPKKTPRKKK